MKTIKFLHISFIITIIFSCTPEVPIEMQEESSANLEQLDNFHSVQNAVSGEYLVVFKKDSALPLQDNSEELVNDELFLAIKEDIYQKARTLLEKSASQTATIEAIYTNAIQGFSVKNLTETVAETLKNNPTVEWVVPNYQYNEKLSPREEDNASMGRNYSFVTLPLGDKLHSNQKRVGFKNTIHKNERIFMIGSGIHRDAWRQLRIDFSKATSVMSGLHWSFDSQYDGAANALVLGAKYDGQLSVGVAAGAKLVPVKAKHNYVINLIDLLDAIEYIHINATSSDIFIYSPNSYENQPTHPAVTRGFQNLSRKMVGVMAAPYAVGVVPTHTVPPYHLNLQKLWITGNGRYNFTPTNQSAYGPNIDTWAPSFFTSVIFGSGQTYTWYGGNQVSSAMTAAVLYARGNNTIGTQGSINYQGFTAPKLKL